ncbi:MAG: 7-carboxy-7-deazaguanine synthase QueE [Nitrospirae bacterium]|nr:7-carboxy-7-deazaguanine synthase QueE [Nitrospirota bacterium]
MRISEIFASIQGEGRLAGTPSVFVRTSFCNLRCRWCDTPYTSWTPEFEWMDAASLGERVERLSAEHGTRHLVLTGGEPLLQAEALRPLCERWWHEGYHLTLETNATIFEPLAVHLASLSPKLRHSIPDTSQNGHGPELSFWHARTRLQPDVIRSFLDRYNGGNGRDCQVKFVVESERELGEIDSLAAQIPIPREKILLMPQVVETAKIPRAYASIRELCRRTGFGFSPRLHIERFGNRRGT